MANYYYTGRTIVPIAVGGGEVKSVRPYTTVEIDDSATGDAHVRRLLSRHVLRLTGRPAGVTQVRVVVEKTKLPPDPGDTFGAAIEVEGKRVGPGIAVKSGPPAGSDVKPSGRPQVRKQRRKKSKST